MVKSFALVLGLLLCGGSAEGQAEGTYFVQFGALKHPQNSFTLRARELGQISTQTTQHGITRYRLGPFASRRDAEGALRGLHGAGYRDAFVHEGALPERAPKTRRRSRVRPTERAARLASLPEEIRATLVLMDGALLVPTGDRLIPVEEYTP